MRRPTIPHLPDLLTPPVWTRMMTRYLLRLPGRVPVRLREALITGRRPVPGVPHHQERAMVLLHQPAAPVLKGMMAGRLVQLLKTVLTLLTRALMAARTLARKDVIPMTGPAILHLPDPLAPPVWTRKTTRHRLHLSGWIPVRPGGRLTMEVRPARVHLRSAGRPIVPHLPGPTAQRGKDIRRRLLICETQLPWRSMSRLWTACSGIRCLG